MRQAHSRCYFHYLLIKHSEIQLQPESPLLRLPGELRNKIYGYVFSTVPEYPNLMVERDLQLKNIIDPYHQNPDRKDCNLSLAITQTCRQIRTETRLLPYTYAKYEISSWFVCWLMVLDDDARTAAWDALMQTEKDMVKVIYNVHCKDYEGGAYPRFGDLFFGNLRVVFDLFLQAN